MKKIWTVIGCLCILAGIIASLVFYEPVQPAGQFIWAALSVYYDRPWGSSSGRLL